MMFNIKTIEEAKKHAIEQWPNESCGIIANNTYIKCTNVSENPENNFKISKQVSDKYYLDGSIQAIIHSHPAEKFFSKSGPSSYDMQCYIDSNVPWGIIDVEKEFAYDPYWLCEENLDHELIGVEFQHGIFDCYSAIRRWYWQKRGIKLIEIPRDNLWWDKGCNLYVDNFKKAGFVLISTEIISDGDIIMGKVNSNIINHAGVYLSNDQDGIGLVYHHLPNRLSRREPATPWVNRAEMVLRYAN